MYALQELKEMAAGLKLLEVSKQGG